MKRLITTLITSMAVCMGVVVLASPAIMAADLIPNCADTGSTICTETNQGQNTTDNRFYGPNGLLTKVAAIIMYIGGIAAVIMLVLGGFTFITGSGDPNALTAAKKTVLYAVVGLVVLVLPAAIIQFVVGRL